VDDRLNRHDLTDEEWRLVPMMPADARQGRRWSDHRMVIDGIFFRTRTGCPWRDLPGEYRNWKTAYNRHCCFSKLKQFRAVATRYDKREFMYEGTVDVSSIRIWLRDPVT
jgi:transposase